MDTVNWRTVVSLLLKLLTLKAKLLFNGSETIPTRTELKRRRVRANDGIQYNHDVQKRLPHSVRLIKCNQ